MALMWGLLDTQDNTWIGDDFGPVLHEEEWTAKVAAQVVDVQLGQEPGRTRAREFPAQQNLRLKETVDTKMGTLEALEGLEEGRF